MANVRIFYTDDRFPDSAGTRMRFKSLSSLESWLKSRPWVTIRKMLMEYDYSHVSELNNDYYEKFKKTSLSSPEARSLF